jgi:hypothetical protein
MCVHTAVHEREMGGGRRKMRKGGRGKEVRWCVTQNAIKPSKRGGQTLRL